MGTPATDHLDGRAPRRDREPRPTDEVLAVLAGWDRGVSGTAVRGGRLVHVEFVWGTAVTIELADVAGREEAARAALAGCTRWFADVDLRFSTYRVLSEVTALRNGLLGPGRASADLAGVVAECTRLRAATSGAFDPWAVPGGFDPSGYVKGWAAGLASRRLLTAGFADHMVNAGGDVTCSGDRRPGSGRGWPIGILDPSLRNRVLRTVGVHDASIATSGRYERGAHVVDPRTGSAAHGADSATVVGPDAGWADALASAALVDGPSCARWLPDLGPEWSVHLVVAGKELARGPAFEADHG